MQNNKKKALILGASGQDGAYLSELLLSKDYEVFGFIRKHADRDLTKSNIGHLLNDMKLFYGDITDIVSIQQAIIRSQPHEIYNLAAQSHVQVSYENPIATAQCVGMGVLNLLEAVRIHSPYSRVLQASSSEMYGNNREADGSQNEKTALIPANPYSAAKVFAHNICRNYREGYGLFVVNSIAQNHESPRRPVQFLTAKVVQAAVMISKGLINELKLGNLTSSRDFSHAKDVTKAMWMMMQHDKPDDWVVSSGVSKTVADVCEYAFSKVGLNYQDYVKLDAEFIRPEETRHLKGDSTKIRTILGWKPEYTFESLIDEMIEHYQKLLA